MATVRSRAHGVKKEILFEDPSDLGWEVATRWFKQGSREGLTASHRRQWADLVFGVDLRYRSSFAISGCWALWVQDDEESKSFNEMKSLGCAWKSRAQLKISTSAAP